MVSLSLHWTIPRAEARWFINIYKDRPDMNQILLELAKLDFNIVQAKYQQELKHVSRWWKRTCIAEKLPFARDRLVECFFWNIGVLFEPHYGFSRIDATKVNVFITIMDDIYDVYGTFQELELFTFIIERWDVSAIERLPNYMQIFYLALNNFINEMAYDVLREKGIVIIPYLRKVDELERGDVPKSIQCYMNETGASKDESCKHIRFLICETWKKINKDRDANCPFSQTFIEIALNLARMAQYM
ncbi:terpene synthase 10-like isoform X2 [Olea europaea subsp. europaea]|uniref:Terpene synthase 10-like isoform X2 n=1 Tax=Olea europaea subsp. europaea TaxID=158383 RepID=A0A8S0RDL3_OLEEU|nr:terpene synthase 10-like isoform X2 [Olea europaea subsp. europaea]